MAFDNSVAGISNTNALPNIPVSKIIEAVSRKNAIKPSTPDIIQSKLEDVPFEELESLIFESISAQELITISRNDLINGQYVSYNLIANSSQIQSTYNPENIIIQPGLMPSFFKNFPIKFEFHVPENGTEPAIPLESEDPFRNVVHRNSDGEIVIDVINLAPGERVDIQISNRAQAIDVTIDSN
jgi:hypothetical protein